MQQSCLEEFNSPTIHRPTERINMSKPLSSFPESQRKAVAERRATNVPVGLATLAARDYLELLKRGKRVKKSS